MNIGQYIASLGGVRSIDSKHAFGFDRKHTSKVSVVPHAADGRPAGRVCEHRDGRQDARILARPIIVRAREHPPEVNAAWLARLGYRNPPRGFDGFIRGLPFARDVIKAFEDMTGKRVKEGDR